MITKTVKYENFDGETRTKEFAFHISKAEAAELRFRKNGSDLAEVLIDIAENENIREILELFKEILAAAVGRRSEDGERFIKNDDIRSELFDTNAYSALLFEMLDDANMAANFVKGMLPKDMQKDMQTAIGGPDNMETLSREELLNRMRELQSEK